MISLRPWQNVFEKTMQVTRVKIFYNINWKPSNLSHCDVQISANANMWKEFKISGTYWLFGVVSNHSPTANSPRKVSVYDVKMVSGYQCWHICGSLVTAEPAMAFSCVELWQSLTAHVMFRGQEQSLSIFLGRRNANPFTPKGLPVWGPSPNIGFKRVDEKVVLVGWQQNRSGSWTHCLRLTEKESSANQNMWSTDTFCLFFRGDKNIPRKNSYKHLGASLNHTAGLCQSEYSKWGGVVYDPWLSYFFK